MRFLPGLALSVGLGLARCVLGQDGVGVSVQQGAPVKRPLAQGSISGHVYFGDTKRPARGARVILIPAAAIQPGEAGQVAGGQPRMALTALDGSYLIPHVAPGEYFVMVFAVGYLAPLDGLIFTGNESAAEQKATEAQLREKTPPVRISGAESARADVELERGAILSGKVIYSDGSPAAQLPVELQKADKTKQDGKPEEQMDSTAAIRMLFLGQNSNTDDQGHFRISGIAGGSYRLAVSQGFGADSIGEQMMAAMNPAAKPGERLTIYSGNTLHQKAAKFYELKPGDTIDGIEIILPLTGLHSIHGSAMGKDGVPLEFGSVSLKDTADSGISFHASVRAGGEFHFTGIPEGIYEIKLTNGRIFENAPQEEIPEEQVLAMQQEFKPTRAFEDTTGSVVVQNSDVEGIRLTPADGKLPELPPPGSNPAPGSNIDEAVGEHVIIR